MDYSFLLILGIGVVALWLMSSRTRKQQREAADFRANLTEGDEVMTASGLFGTVVAVDDDVITLESVPGSQTRWLRAAIAKRIDAPVVDEDEGDDEADEDLEELEDESIEVPDDLSSLTESRADVEADGDHVDDAQDGPTTDQDQDPDTKK
ncbi:preprotein translocase subunit YajC [Cellulomonas soli]|uniref:preprotein translocase subunit YajC n=1 Tax=Cellulomonas soli TaxID=931535 RepID=UPI003F86FA89